MRQTMRSFIQFLRLLMNGDKGEREMIWFYFEIAAV